VSPVFAYTLIIAGLSRVSTFRFQQDNHLSYALMQVPLVQRIGLAETFERRFPRRPSSEDDGLIVPFSTTIDRVSDQILRSLQGLNHFFTVHIAHHSSTILSVSSKSVF